MAIDNTPPRLKLIVTIAVITVITLIGINFATQSYYAMMTDEASREKIAPTRDRNDQVKAEQAALTGASIPVEQAMAQIAKGTRPDSITPQPSDDTGPLTGWSKLPKAAPVPQAHAEPTRVATDGGANLATDGGTSMATDGGTNMAADGGKPAAPAKDAGAPKH